MTALTDMFTKNLRQSGILIAFVAITLLFTILTKGVLLDPQNVTNIVLQYSYILILAIGMLFVIVIGHIDLSVGSVMALVGAIAATAPTRATTEPTERSMWPTTMTNSMPIARIRM